MNNNKWLFALGGLILGAVIAIAVVKSTDKPINTEVVNNQQSNTNSMESMNSMMASSTANLKAKTGDDFDKAFIQEMIMHHQGAIDMANTALTNANHQEIKTMAQDIISAQQKEITQMNQWMQQWYGIGGMEGMNH